MIWLELVSRLFGLLGLIVCASIYILWGMAANYAPTPLIVGFVLLFLASLISLTLATGMKTKGLK